MSRFILHNTGDYDKAAALFRSFGVEPLGLSLDELRARRRQIALRHHPDNGGDAATMTEINAAFDVLKGHCGQLEMGLAQIPKTDDESNGAGWANLGGSGKFGKGSPKIYRKDYRDINFLKKTLWEKAGPAAEPFVVQTFDGEVFDGAVQTYGSPAIFSEMGRAIAFWNNGGPLPGRTVAVFARRLARNDELTLIFLDGRPVEPARLKLEGRDVWDPCLVQAIKDLLASARGRDKVSKASAERQDR